MCLTSNNNSSYKKNHFYTFGNRDRRKMISLLKDLVSKEYLSIHPTINNS
jgi:hypothetical protein